MNIEKYKEILKKLASTSSKDFINNSSIEHASAMIEELFLNSKGTVRILTDHLKPAVYDRESLKFAATEFMKVDGNQLKVICQLNDDKKESLSQNKFLSHLKEYRDKIELFEAIGTTKKGKKHFMVVTTKADKYALRFEMDTNAHIATGTFNAGDAGENLFNYFDGCIKDDTKANKIDSKTIGTN